MFSFVKKCQEEYSSVKTLVGKKIRHWQKKSSFFVDVFSSDKLVQIAAWLILNEKQSDCCESAEARNHNVKTSLSAAEIGSLMLVVVRFK